MRDYKQLPNGTWVRCDNNHEKRFCEVCGSTDEAVLEHHHWAPKYLFGDKADSWPTSLLCRTCHLIWHDIVTPGITTKPPTKRAN